MSDKTAVYERLVKESYKKIKALEAEVAAQRLAQKEPIAIIGLGCRFPGGAGPAELWQSLRQGLDAITEVPPDRWRLEDYYDPQPRTPGKTYARHGGFVDHLDGFDADFFGISQREANVLDPQQRLLLEVSWEALENARRPPELLPRQTGVFIGIAWGDYYQKLKSAGAALDFYAGTGSSFASASGRLSYFYGWQGPNIALDTACSSSLVAVHLAVASLRNGECEAALAGGVNRIVMPDSAISFSQAEALAPDGRCKTFDAAADGYVRSEGCGVIILKRLRDAQRDGDDILAVIRGSAVNHDGRTSGLTVPSGPAQQATIRHALQNGGVTPSEVSFVETHGTGTALGDPIEVNALGAVFGKERTAPLLLGAIKTNIGHTEAAAGIAGVIKVVLAIQHGEIPPNLHFRNPSPHIQWAKLPLAVPTLPVPWPTATRIAGVSSFGVSGTNAHLVLEAPPEKSAGIEAAAADSGAVEGSLQLLPMSAKSDAALAALVARYAEYLGQTHATWADICYTAGTGRSHFPKRLAVVAADKARAQAELAELAASQPPDTPTGGAASGRRPLVAFIFTGGGAQYVNMGRRLYETQPVFRQVLDRCDATMQAEFGESLLAVLYPKSEPASTPDTAQVIDQIAYTQPTMYALGCALAEVWKSWGIEPAVVMGHSLGEYIAAYVAGVFTLEDGFRLITARGRLMAATADGAMVAVRAGQAAVASAIAGAEKAVSIAAINSPDSVVISGQRQAVQQIVARLAGVETRPVAISVAAHSPLMEPVLDRFEQLAQKVSFQPPRIPIMSNVSGQLLPEGQPLDAGYWRMHTRAPVQFMASIDALYGAGYRVMLEVGPHPTLSSLGAACIDAPAELEPAWLPSLVRAQDDWQVMLETLGELYTRGLEVDWRGVQSRSVSGEPQHRAHPGSCVLPNYPFQRKRFWFHAAEPASDATRKEACMESPAAVDSAARLPQLQQEVCAQVAKKLYLSQEQVDVDRPFVEMGGDSVQLADVVRVLEKQYRVKIGVRRLFDELNTVAALTRYLDANLPAEHAVMPGEAPAVLPRPSLSGALAQTVPSIPAQPLPPAPADASAIERIVNQQLQAMSQLMAQQLAALGQLPAAAPTNVPGRAPNKPPPSTVATAPVYPSPKLQSRAKETLTPRQQSHVNALIEQLNRRTAKSKQLAQSSRPTMADSRAAAGFRPLIKEMIYPICCSRSQGAEIWDVDGNQYLDFTMGFGVSLFGHQAPFIVNALRQQLDASAFQIGPQSPLAGEVARLLCELTGMQRAAFCNSGTEAVLTAIRLARTATGRTKVARFAGDYNGHFDGVLTIAASGNADPAAIPMCPGVPQSAVDDMLVLEFAEPSSLSILRARAHELAAVITSPVHSRRPHIQAPEFLRELRKITQEAGAALISDEILMGFRVHPGPTHAWLGVEVDIATYGKLIGGGLPIGAVTGTARFMDCLDGGYWQYGDDSFPQAETTIFAGTFNKNPLTMAATRAVLTFIKEQSAPLYDRLNALTARLARELGAFFVEQGVPLQITHLGGTFRITSPQNLDLFFYHLLNRGIYIWEGRAFFISFAHTDEHIDRFIQVVKETVRDLQSADFFPQPAAASGPRTAPLSEAQKQLWTLAQLSPGGSLAYHVPLNLMLRGPLRLDALRQTVQTLVDRHEALRTTIDGAGQLQLIAPFLTLAVPLVDLSQEAAPETAVARWFAEQNQRPFELVKGPLVRAHVLKLQAERHLLTISVHHIVGDGWSMSVMAGELAALYSAACRGVRAELPAPALYRDFVERQLAQRESEPLAAQERYWLEQLKDAPPPVHLPSDRPRPPTASYKAGRQSLRLDAELTQKLRSFARAQGCTLYMALLSGFTLLLHRLTGQEELLLGSPTSGRQHEGSEGVVGYCTHFHPLRSRLAPNQTCAEYLAALKHTVLAAFGHADYPYARLLNRLREQGMLERKVDNAAGFITTVFSFDPPVALPAMHGLTVELFSQPIGYSPYDLVANVVDVEGQLVWDVDYSCELFDATTIERWLGHLQTLLRHLVDDPGAPAESLALLSAAERQELLGQWNATAVTYPDRRVHQLLEAQAEKTPDAPAVMFPGSAASVLTYRELNSRANQLAHHLRSLGVGPEVIVGVYLERSVELIVSIAGILKAGGAYLPLDTSFPAARLEQMVCHARPLAVLTQSALLANVPRGAAQLVCLDSAPLAELPTENPDCVVQPQHLVYVIYTSGSTGVPKGVAMPHAGMTNLTFFQLQHFTWKQPARTLQFSPVGFDVSAQEIFSTWASGGTLCLIAQETRRDAEALHKFLREHAIERLFAPFVALQQLAEVDADQPALTQLRELITAGEQLRITAALGSFLARVPTCTLCNHYGPTETHLASLYQLTGAAATWPMLPPIGRPIANAQIYLLDGRLQPVPIGVVGELYIGGAQLARGYLNQPELTRERFLEVPASTWQVAGLARPQRLYKTGDLARYLPDGNIEFLGRADDQIKIRGFRIELGEIEVLLANHPDVHQAVVTAHGEGTGKRIAAYYVLAPGADASELRAYLRARLPDFMLPSAFIAMDAFPLTPSGKVDRRRLPPPELAAAESPGTPPSSPTEVKLAEIWSELLHLQQVDVHANFFDLGGHSLLLTQIGSRIRQLFTVQLPLQYLFQVQTIAAQAKLIESLQQLAPAETSGEREVGEV